MEQRLPPQPLPDHLLGDTWRYGAILSGDLPDLYEDRPIPYQSVPERLSPLNMGLSSNILVPGVVIVGGKRSLALASWLQSIDGRSIHAIKGSPDGLILYAGERDRWILATYDDAEMKQASQQFVDQQQLAQGLHFLLVQPDDSGMTYTGFWLLQRPVPEPTAPQKQLQ
jgi:hypothetical protein